MTDPAPTSLSPRARWLAPAAAFALGLAADQLTKVAARHNLTPGRPKVFIDGFWNWELAGNPGAAFSTFSDGTARWLLTAIAIIALGAIGWMIARSAPQQRMQRIALGLVASGALGNLIDRVYFGVVTDFIRWHWHAHRYPIFNVADASLLVGVAVLLIDSFRKPAPSTT